MDTLTTIINFVNDSINTIQTIKPTENFGFVESLDFFQIPTILATSIGAAIAIYMGIWGEKRKSITNIRILNVQKKIDFVTDALKEFKKQSRIVFKINRYPDMDWDDFKVRLLGNITEIGEFSEGFVSVHEMYLDNEVVELFDEIFNICEELGWERAEIESRIEIENVEDIIELDMHLAENYIDRLLEHYNQIEPLLKKQLERHFNGKL